jgi:N6-L-threonylcarbamoyladenine synthase
LSPQGDENAFTFPKPKVAGSPYDYSFSGLKTSVINIMHNAQQKGEQINIANLASSFQASVVNCLLSNFENVAVNFGYNKLVLAGGVSANSKLRCEAEKICKAHGWQLFLPELKYCGDNAAMIASQGYYEFKNGTVANEALNAYATMPLDDLHY